ncbi:V-type ATPase 116kDa subunit family protein [mine drainage metagenome]|uniref:V-type ATPase 116kDa subunit family protein n=1 Tax=mine drainage metagenome TaxID=410659 RepID=T1ADV3_9ZZZZ
MGILRPVKMQKIGIVGLKEDREAVLTTLHDLGLTQVETVSADTLQYLDPERGNELQRVVGDEALRFRGLKSALPPIPVGAVQTFQDLDATLAAAKSVPTAEVDDTVGALQREDDQLQSETRSIGETLDLLGKLSFYHAPLSYLDPKSYLIFLGETDPETYDTLRGAVPPEAEAMFFAGTSRAGSSCSLHAIRPRSSRASPRRARSSSPRSPTSTARSSKSAPASRRDVPRSTSAGRRSTRG